MGGSSVQASGQTGDSSSRQLTARHARCALAHGLHTRFTSRLATLLVFLPVVLAPPVLASSDLTPAIYGPPYFVTDASVDPGDVAEGCAGAATGRTLLRFGTRVTNLGPDDLVIGNPGCPDCQANPGAPCQDPRFVCSASNYRVHFRSAARFELLDPAGTDVLVGSKRGYCFNDDACAGGKSPQYTSCDGVQGLSVGCVDVYEPTLDCQYLDVTDVPNATTRAFRLRVTIDTLSLLPDPDRTNDVTEMAIPGCGDGIVQAGEECDPPPGAAAGCCDAATCHLLPAGTTCRPTSGPCDAAEACDGTSPQCPADVALPDGTACGGGMPPCLAEQCRAGRCESSLAAGACLIDGRCATAGAFDPGAFCERCDPARATDAWSPDVAADERGVLCQLDRVAAAVHRAACRPRVLRSIATPLRQVRRAIRKQFRIAVNGARSSAALRLARRLSRVVARAGTRMGCNVDDAPAQLDVLLGQLTAMAGR
jgi:hypothetical protein